MSKLKGERHIKIYHNGRLIALLIGNGACSEENLKWYRNRKGYEIKETSQSRCKLRR